MHHFYYTWLDRASFVGHDLILTELSSMYMLVSSVLLFHLVVLVESGRQRKLEVINLIIL